MLIRIIVMAMGGAMVRPAPVSATRDGGNLPISRTIALQVVRSCHFDNL